MYIRGIKVGIDQVICHRQTEKSPDEVTFFLFSKTQLGHRAQQAPLRPVVLDDDFPL
ncbi:MAG: hypothetical protein ACOCXZ_01615 [Chloroflexota bacterium]